MNDLTSLSIPLRGPAEGISALELTEAYIAAVEKARILNAYIVETAETRHGKNLRCQIAEEARAGRLKAFRWGIALLSTPPRASTPRPAATSSMASKPTYELTVTANLGATAL